MSILGIFKKSKKVEIPDDIGVTVEIKDMSYEVGNMQGLGTREQQEDSFGFVNAFSVEGIRENGMLFIVADGMGGMQGGKTASEKVVQVIRGSFAFWDREDNLSLQIKESVILASKEVEDILQGMGGSTVVVGMIYNDMLHFASVGDSFLYLKRGNHLYRLNTEHNVKNYMYRQSISSGEFDPTDGRCNLEAAALTKFIGMNGIELEDIDGTTRPFKLLEGDVIMACSDGVGGVLNEEEIMTCMSLDKPQQICEQLEQRVIMHAKEYQDNYTATVIKCN